MNEKLPYYMMYPLPFLMEDEKKSRKDREYLKSIYPEIAKKILPYIERECDRYDYRGSVIYDECPDRLQLLLMAGRIFREVCSAEKWEKDDGDGTFPETAKEITEILLYHEIMKRRESGRGDSVHRIWY